MVMVRVIEILMNPLHFLSVFAKYLNIHYLIQFAQTPRREETGTGRSERGELRARSTTRDCPLTFPQFILHAETLSLPAQSKCALNYRLTWRVLRVTEMRLLAGQLSKAM